MMLMNGRMVMTVSAKTDPYLRDIQTAQYYAYAALSKRHPKVFEMYKEMFKGVSVDYNNKAFRAVRKEHELEFQELYEQEALKRGIKTNYHRRKAMIARIREELRSLELDPTKPMNVRLISQEKQDE